MAGITVQGWLAQLTFSDLTERTSEFISPESSGSLTIFVAPVGCDVSAVPEVMDPGGAWHAVQDARVVSDGKTDGFWWDLNTGPTRMKVTPSIGSGTCKIWANGIGG